MTIKYKLTETAKKLKEKGVDVTPKRIQKGDVGWDLCACIEEPVPIFPDEVVKIPTGVHIWLGDGLLSKTENNMAYAGLYLPRSGNSGLMLANTVGLLDSGYQHESFCKWRNLSNEVLTISPGERMAQLVVIPAFITSWEYVDDFGITTGRGKGDGSSGK